MNLRRFGSLGLKWWRLNSDFLRASLSRGFPEVPLDRPSSVLGANLPLKNRHLGQRAFVLCNGTSISQENLLPLRGEICFSVSNFYKHPEFSQIQPSYHFVPNVFPPQTDEDTAKWFQEMGEQTMGCTYLLGARQRKLVSDFDLFPGAQKFFLQMDLPSDSLSGMPEVDLCQPVAGVQSVTIMCLMAAMYMGFKEVYLLGVDHDALFKGRYDYFFDRQLQLLEDPAVDRSGVIRCTLLEQLEAMTNLWKQYYAIQSLAEKQGLKIVNLSQGSVLDIFPKSTLLKVLGHTEFKMEESGGSLK